jgi:uncharacterized protein (DUF1800 family)
MMRRFPFAALFVVASFAGAPAMAVADDKLGHDDALWLGRITYGIESDVAARFRTLGRRRFLDEQLQGKDDTLPPAIQAQIARLTVAQTSPAQLVVDEIAEQKRINALTDDAAKQDARKARGDFGNKLIYEATREQVLRATYSPAQLKEQMVWFWLNHFNVFAQKGYVKFLLSDYVDRSIRPHALGKFRDLVMATLTNPAMLQYLDNSQNAANHINENYARELMELHTLGVDAGYSQADVQELAAILTGVGIDTNHDDPKLKPEWQKLLRRDGLFEFNPARHDFGDRVLLGQKIKGGGFEEVQHAVEVLVEQPACARFVSRRMAMYFVADEPPKSLVDAMARTFQRSHGDIADVLRTMLTSREFEASLGKKFKDPMHYVVSSVRFAYDGKPILNSHPIVNWLNGQGEQLFGHTSPDGYPLVDSAWSSSGQMSKRFDIARAIGSGNAGLFDAEDGDKGTVTGFPQLSTRLYFDNVQPYLSAATLSALDRSTSQQEWNTFLLSSPEFNSR